MTSKSRENFHINFEEYPDKEVKIIYSVNYESILSYRDQLSNCNSYIVCIGGKKKKDYKKVDYEYVVKIGKLAELNGA